MFHIKIICFGFERYLPVKKHRQIAHTQIRLLLEKQSDQGFPCLLFRPALCEFQLGYINIVFESKNRKVFENCEHLHYGSNFVKMSTKSQKL